MPIRGRLAVVDDDRAFTDYLATWLGSRGLTVDVFHSGAELIEALQAGATPNVVLLDVLMPDLNGLETLRRIRQLHPGAQVIMLSGRNAPSTVIEAVRLGAADYVLKPDDPDGVGEAALEAAINHGLEREALASEVARLGAQLAEDPDGTQPCWSAGTAMQQVMSMVERVADSDVDVLLRGESGVGKEVIARELHRRSERRARPWVKVNCAALPADLLESELFGHERGAFTGAGQARMGKFEFANTGTIMLDEIGEMPVGLQAKILHVLQDRTLTRLGSNRPVEVDVRVIAATNRDLEAMMRAGTFREDLYYRLQVIELRIPPLRERDEEIAPLVEFFLAKYAKVYRRPAVRPSPALVRALQVYPWPGNIRELENMVKRLVVLQDEHHILSELDRLQRSEIHAVAMTAPPASSVLSAPGVRPNDATFSESSQEGRLASTSDSKPEGGLHEVARQAALKAERKAIEDALAIFRWNRRKVADYLDVSYKTLLTKMRACGISESPDS